MRKSFRLQPPEPPMDKAPVIRIKPIYYKTILELKRQSGIPLGNIVEQCIDYALDNMEVGADE